MPETAGLTAEEVARGSEALTWHAHDGTPFPGLTWKPRGGSARAEILCIHGLSGAASDFGPVARHLASEGCRVWAINLRGQGHDPDPRRRGHFLKPEEWRADLATFVEDFVHGDMPFFVIGESMGALVAVDAVTSGTLQPRRLVLSVPVTALRAPVPGWALSLMRRAARVAPRFKLSPLRFVHGKKCVPRLTSDDRYMDYLRNIPHRVNGFTLEFLRNFHDLMRATPENATRLVVPTLMLSGGRDVFIDPRQSREFFECLAAPVKEFALYPESHHLLWHDADADDVIDRISRWIMEDAG